VALLGDPREGNYTSFTGIPMKAVPAAYKRWLVES
jgi:hypothetical protein